MPNRDQRASVLAIAAALNLFTPTALTDAGTITPDISVTGMHWTLLATSGVGATRAIANPTNTPAAGAVPFTLRYTQDATGGRALTFGNKFVLPLNFAVATAANAVTMLRGVYYQDIDKYICDGYQSTSTVAQVATTQTVASSTTATDVVDVIVKGGTLGTTGQLYVDIPFEFLNNQATATTLTITITFGGTTFYSEVSTAQTGSIALAHPGLISIILSNVNATNVNRMGGSVSMGNGVATTTGRGDMNTVIANATGFSTPITGATGAIDTTTDQHLKVTITMSVNNAAVTFLRYPYTVYMLGNGATGVQGPAGPSGAGTVSVPVNNVGTATYTFAGSDLGKKVRATNAGTNVLTMPHGVFSVGDVGYFMHAAASGTTSIASDGTSVLNKPDTLTAAKQYAWMTWHMVSSSPDTFDIMGYST